MALIGVTQCSNPREKGRKPLILTLDVPGGKKRLYLSKVSSWNFITISFVSFHQSQLSLGLVHFRVHLKAELALGASAWWPLPSTGFVGRTQ